MLELSELLGYDEAVLQCHDNPDVDAIASAFALSRYFAGRGVKPHIVYSGSTRVTKPNIAGFLSLLPVELVYVEPEQADVRLLCPGAARPLLVMVDCQYGAGNATRFSAAAGLCVIDHHIVENELPPLSRVEPYLGSCATVVWRMLGAAGFDVNADRDVSTALYYGLYTDTNSLSEIHHPLDRDMLESLKFDAAKIRWLKHNNITKEELVIAGNALIDARFDEKNATGLFMTAPCDPNILGFINDLTIQAKGVDVGVGFCALDGGVKLSVRSATNDVMAHELAGFLTEGCGSGGGNREKAGGFLRLAPGVRPEEYLARRIREYHASFDKIYAGSSAPDLAGMAEYKKRIVPNGVVALRDIYPAGTDVSVRTLEGDAVFTVADDDYVMLGVRGEVYPIRRERFEQTYRMLQGPFSYLEEVCGESFYAPTVKDVLYHRAVDLAPHAKPCVANGESYIYAKELGKTTKVFSSWYTEGYMLGRPGDYLAVRADDTDDVYVIEKNIFGLTYDAV